MTGANTFTCCYDISARGESRTAATSKMEHFVIRVIS